MGLGSREILINRKPRESQKKGSASLVISKSFVKNSSFLILREKGLLVGIMTLGLGMTLAMTLIGEIGEIGVTYHVYIVRCSVGRTLTVYPPTEPR